MKIIDDDYYNKYKDPEGCRITFWVIITLGILILSMLFCPKVKAQRWKNENRGLYPQSLQLTYNARNTAIGIRYSYLFEKPFYGLPVGLYDSFSNTIKPDMRYNNYYWERKCSVGVMLTLPCSRDMKSIHTMITIGAIYNILPAPKIDDPALYNTSIWGCDIGVQLQKNRYLGHISIDVLNFMRYVELGFGYTFYKIKP